MENINERKFEFSSDSIDIYQLRVLRYSILYIGIVFIVLSLVFVYSSSCFISEKLYGDSLEITKKHVIWMFLGISAFFVFSKVDTSIYKKYIKQILALGIIIGLLPFIPGVGKMRGEAIRWINLGFISINTSELIKIVLVLYISSVISIKKDKRSFLRTFLPIFIVTVTFFVIISFQLDISTAFLIFLTAVIVMYVSEIPIRYIILTTLAIAIFLYLWIPNLSYIQARLVSFVDPWSDPFNKGYQSIMFMESFGNGAMGVGIGNGVLKNGRIPEPHTDSLFAVITEEIGFIGGIFVVLLYAIFFILSLKAGRKMNDPYRSPMVIGFASMISVWSLGQIAVVSGVLPPTGVNLSFLSYGGANMLTSCIVLAIIYRSILEFEKGVHKYSIIQKKGSF